MLSALVDFASSNEAGSRLQCAFGAPLELLVAHTREQVRPVLREVHAYALKGYWCVGYLRYEAACAFDSAMRVFDPDGPLAWFAVHKHALPWPIFQETVRPSRLSFEWGARTGWPDLRRALACIQREIINGAVYQVNYTGRLCSRFPTEWNDVTGLGAEVCAFFSALCAAQCRRGYFAWLDAGTEQVLSASPELFFEWTGNQLLARPMKGTASRGADAQADARSAWCLRNSAKDQAENLMIVDLLRNDMSRIAEPFSVRVARLFSVEALATVWQMTSDIHATTYAGATLEDLFSALFPCGSVTGTPKLSAMRLIHELEREPRGIYCGALGVVKPGGSAIFNVPIRTVTARGGQLSCGVGSGITIDSLAESEWQEWCYKRAFLDQASDVLAFETVRSGFFGT